MQERITEKKISWGRRGEPQEEKERLNGKMNNLTPKRVILSKKFTSESETVLIQKSLNFGSVRPGSYLGKPILQERAKTNSEAWSSGWQKPVR